MHIRKATKDDVPAISALILSLAHHFTLQPNGAGAQEFLLSLQPSGIEGYVDADPFDYCIGMVDAQIAGVVAVRARTHLFHLFVAEPVRRRGLAKALWLHAKSLHEQASVPEAMTVNATPFALPFYEHVGFRATGPRVETRGIAFVLMVWVQGCAAATPVQSAADYLENAMTCGFIPAATVGTLMGLNAPVPASTL